MKTISLHVLHGALVAADRPVAQKLDVIDKWGKILTVITVVFGLLIAAALHLPDVGAGIHDHSLGA